MGETKFSYNAYIDFRHELMFKYLYGNSVENSFVYQRYIALSDASVFNNPVAITKVATGFTCLHELFVDKNAHITNYYKMNAMTITNYMSPDLSSDIGIRQYKESNIIPENWVTNPKNVYAQDAMFVHFRKSFVINEEVIFGDNAKQSHINDCIYANKDRNSINMLPIYNARKTKDTGAGNVFNTYLAEKVYGNIANVTYQDMMASRDRLGFNILPVYNASTDIKIGWRHYQCLQGWMDRNSFVILPMFNVSCPDRRYKMNILPMILGYRIFGGTKYYDNMSSVQYLHDKRMVKNDVAFAQLPSSRLNENIDYILSLRLQDDKKMCVFENVHNAPVEQRNASWLKSLFVQKDRLDLQSNKDVFVHKIGGKYIKVMTQCLVYGQGKDSGYLDLDTFCIVQQKYLTIQYKDIPVFKHEKQSDADKNSINIDVVPDYASYIDSGISFDVKEKSSSYSYSDVTFDNSQRYFAYTPNSVRVDNTDRYASWNHGIKWFEKVFHSVSYIQNSCDVSKVRQSMAYIPVDVNIGYLWKDATTHEDIIFIDKRNGDMATFPVNTFIEKLSKDFGVIKNTEFVFRDSIDVFVYETTNFIYKLPKDLANPDTEEQWTSRTSYDINVHDTMTEIYRISYDMNVCDTMTGVYRKNKTFQFLINSIFVDKTYRPVSISDLYVGAYKDMKDTAIFRQGVDTLKKYVLASYDYDADSLIKSFRDLNFYDIAPYRGFMLPISKLRRQAYIDRIDEMAKKLHRPVMIDRDWFASSLARPTGGIIPDLFCDKEAHDVFIDYKNDFIIKGIIHAAVFKDEFVSKLGKDIAVYTNTWVSKSISTMWIQDDFVGFSKEQREVMVNCDVSFTKTPFSVVVNPDIFVDGDDKICYYNYGYWAERDKYKMTLYQQEAISPPQKDIHILDLTPAIKPIGNMYVNQIYHAETLKHTSLYQQIEEVHRMYYHCGIRPEDFGNWVWVYETPDPFDKDPYGIDELLLPENDTRYSDFEDIIFDKQRMRPRNPVKKIDETTFIAKYPIKHPTPEYSDVAVNYDDSAIKYENYYGIETSIMRTVFLKYYRIWQSKLFEFSTMTMTQSVKLMLDYMYSWIMIYFPPEQIEQALRVFKLIRWYGESAIIKNSQYIISYEFEDLKSKLTTGTCAIPNDIDPDDYGIVANQTMYVDAANGVIRNNPSLIGVADAHVTFTVNIKKNSTFSFSLLNTVGSVNIYIDSVLVDTLSTSQTNLIYPLNYTGSPITIKIIKDKNNNLNNMFCIGNISIADGAFKDLSIEFDPTLKAGNKPLDEIAKKMLEYANEYDNIQEAYEHIRKANLGVSETYKQMVEYWKIHHENKTKGKRLTIKQV